MTSLLVKLLSSYRAKSALLCIVLAAISLQITATQACAQWTGTPVVSPIMPADSMGTNQDAFNNLAWQQFITLNWAADPQNPGQPDKSVLPSAFGDPSNSSPVVWESYKESSEVFLTGGAQPTLWKAPRALPAQMRAFLGERNLVATSPLGFKGLFSSSKFTGGPQLDLSEFQEAFTNGAWLTAQAKMNNYITLFEKRLNEDEFNYIYNNKLYDAAIQTTFAKTTGINLPDGSSAFASYGTVGAIEIKAAWIQLDDPSLWPMFKTSKAYVSYPTGAVVSKVPAPVTVGLVALHIIRKTPNAQQFMWSTFEHVNNAPAVNETQTPPKPWYTYYDAACNPNTDYYKCVPNSQPDPKKPDPYNAPVQVVRTTPISTSRQNNIANLNTTTWNTIKNANPKSVFLNYQLVNVLWPNNNTTTGGPGATTPLTDGNPLPPEAMQPVANTVLETYHQNIHCLHCHVNATVASTTANNAPIKIRRRAATPGSSSQLASDYSFLFGEAKAAPQSPKP